MRTLNLGILAHGDAGKTTLDDDAEWGTVQAWMMRARGAGCPISTSSIRDVPRRRSGRGSPRFVAYRRDRAGSPGDAQLADSLMREFEKLSDVALRQPDLRQRLNRVPRFRRRDVMLLPSIRPGLDRGCNEGADLVVKDLLNRHVEGLVGDLEQLRNRIPCHGFDAIEPSRLAEHTRKLGDADRPPAVRSLDCGRVVRPHRSHHRLPSTSSNAVRIARAVWSLISRCRGIVIRFPSRAQTSWSPP